MSSNVPGLALNLRSWDAPHIKVKMWIIRVMRREMDRNLRSGRGGVGKIAEIMLYFFGFGWGQFVAAFDLGWPDPAMDLFLYRSVIAAQKSSFDLNFWMFAMRSNNGFEREGSLSPDIALRSLGK
ncbi:hypothetical protein SUGI_1061670 [Cryptomeria japonica]|nr:hypothetical protein SUGI_1061670 [Cryptomeria japonica]